MPLRRLGISNYHLIWRSQVQPPGGAFGQRLVGQFKADPGAMRDLRALVGDSFYGIPNTRLTADQIVAAVARMVASGELVIVRDMPEHGGSATQADVPGDPPPEQSSAPQRGSRSQEPDPPTFPSNCNPGAQAAAMSAAAARGAPFCEH
jgi:hypothetical protein